MAASRSDFSAHRWDMPIAGSINKPDPAPLTARGSADTEESRSWPHPGNVSANPSRGTDFLMCRGGAPRPRLRPGPAPTLLLAPRLHPCPTSSLPILPPSPQHLPHTVGGRRWEGEGRADNGGCRWMLNTHHFFPWSTHGVGVYASWHKTLLALLP